MTLLVLLVVSVVIRYTPPFDRHDWLVQRHDGTEVMGQRVEIKQTDKALGWN